MDAALEGQRRYLVAVFDACSHTALPHSNQLAALEREISLAAATDELATYRAASADLFELTRGAWLDRIANHARVAAAVDDPWGLEAAAVEQRQVLAAGGGPGPAPTGPAPPPPTPQRPGRGGR